MNKIIKISAKVALFSLISGVFGVTSAHAALIEASSVTQTLISVGSIPAPVAVTVAAPAAAPTLSSNSSNGATVSSVTTPALSSNSSNGATVGGSVSSGTLSSNSSNGSTIGGGTYSGTLSSNSSNGSTIGGTTLTSNSSNGSTIGGTPVSTPTPAPVTPTTPASNGGGSTGGSSSVGGGSYSSGGGSSGSSGFAITGGVNSGIVPQNVRVASVDARTLSISWTTATPTYSRIVYGDVSHDSYIGYEYSSPMTVVLSTVHSVNIILTPEVKYYVRPVTSNGVTSTTGAELMIVKHAVNTIAAKKSPSVVNVNSSNQNAVLEIAKADKNSNGNSATVVAQVTPAQTTNSNVAAVGSLTIPQRIIRFSKSTWHFLIGR